MAHVYCAQTPGCIKMPLGMEVGLDPSWAKRHCVRWRPSSPPSKGHTLANFRPMSVVAKWLDVSRYQLVRRSASAQATLLDVVPRDPDPPKKGHSPQFSAHVGCGQMAEWTKMSLGMEVGIGAGSLC